MSNVTRKHQRIRRAIVGSIATVLIIAALVIGVNYSEWKAARLVALSGKYLAAGDGQRAVLMARSALSLQPGNQKGRRALVSAYDTTGDPRILDALGDITGDEFRRTLKAIELGRLDTARESFLQLQPGSMVDPVSYHEIGASLFCDDSIALYSHCLALADAEPERPSRVIELGYVALVANRPLPPVYLDTLVELALLRTDDAGAEAASVALALALVAPERIENDPPVFAAILQNHIERSKTVRPHYLRALECALACDSAYAGDILNALQDLCKRLVIPSETRKVAECLSRLGLHAELASWFRTSPDAFSLPSSPNPDAAMTRLLIADAGVQLQQWQLVMNAVSGGSAEAWGDVLCLRYLYEARSLRLNGSSDLPIANARSSRAYQAASRPWQRRMLAHLADSYHWSEEQELIRQARN